MLAPMTRRRGLRQRAPGLEVMTSVVAVVTPHHASPR